MPPVAVNKDVHKSTFYTWG